MTSPGDQGWTGVDIDGSGIDMYPAPAGQMMIDIAQALNAAQTTWDTANERILGLEGGLGNGPLGRPVAEQYNPTAAQIREFVTDMLRRLTGVSETGSKAVPMYIDTDQRAGQHFEF
jgi:hypothetical protein